MFDGAGRPGQSFKWNKSSLNSFHHVWFLFFFTLVWICVCVFLTDSENSYTLSCGVPVQSGKAPQKRNATTALPTCAGTMSQAWCMMGNAVTVQQGTFHYISPVSDFFPNIDACMANLQPHGAVGDLWESLSMTFFPENTLHEKRICCHHLPSPFFCQCYFKWKGRVNWLIARLSSILFDGIEQDMGKWKLQIG